MNSNSEVLEPTISVIVVVRNGERALPRALASIDEQTRPPDQIVIVDGQSTDRTAAIARAHDTAEYVLQPDLGLGSARNLGIQRSTSAFVCFLDHDDQWHDTKLERQLGAMLDNPSLGYTTTRLRRRRADDVHRSFEQLDGDIVDGATPSTLVVRRDALERVGDFDSTLRLGCDADWFARARDLRVPTLMLNEVLVDKHLHQENLSTDAATNRSDMLEVIRRSLARKRAQEGPT